MNDEETLIWYGEHSTMEKRLPPQGFQDAAEGLKITLFTYIAKQSHLFYFGRILLHTIPYGFIRNFLN